MNDCNLCINGDVTYTYYVVCAVVTCIGKVLNKLLLIYYIFYIFFNPLFPTMIVEHIIH